jgi:hypothetical protein
MKRLSIFPFIFLFNTIKTNIIKSIFVALVITGFYFSQGYTDLIHSKKTAEFVVKNGTSYTYFFAKTNDGDYSSMTTKNPLKNNVYHYTEHQDGYYLFLALGWLSLVILVIAFFVGLGDDEVSWEFDECLQKSLSFLIDCEFEDNKFYYFALGRLVKQTDRQLNDYYRNIAHELNIHSFSDILNCPKFMTKSQRRGKLLDELV